MHIRNPVEWGVDQVRSAKETLKNSVSSILDLGKSKTYIASSVHFPIFSVSP